MRAAQAASAPRIPLAPARGGSSTTTSNGSRESDGTALAQRRAELRARGAERAIERRLERRAARDVDHAVRPARLIAERALARGHARAAAVAEPRRRGDDGRHLHALKRAPHDRLL